MGQGTGAPAQSGAGCGVLRHPLPFLLPLPSPPPIRIPSPAPHPRQLGRRKLLPRPLGPGGAQPRSVPSGGLFSFPNVKARFPRIPLKRNNDAGFCSLRLGFLSRHSAHGFLILFRRPEPDPLRLRGKPCAPARLPPLPETPRTTLSHSAPGGLLGAARPLAPAAFPGAGVPGHRRPRLRPGNSRRCGPGKGWGPHPGSGCRPAPRARTEGGGLP